LVSIPKLRSYLNYIEPTSLEGLKSPNDEEGDAVVGKRLPSLDEVHLGLRQVQVLHVGVGLEDLLPQLNGGKRSVFVMTPF